MAIDPSITTSLEIGEAHGVTERRPRRAAKPWWVVLLEPIASLKLTIVLLALAIVLVLLGTLAQWRMDTFEAVQRYFRTPIARIELGDLVPQSFSPDVARATEAWEVAQRFDDQGHLTNWLTRDITGEPAATKIPEGDTPWLPFPGGMPLGLLMTVNLLAAHGLKFKIQARGTRLWSGIATLAFGAALTYWVVHKQDGAITAGISQDAQDYLWKGIALSLGGLWALAAYGLFSAAPDKKQQRLYTAIGGLLALAAFLFVSYHIMYDKPLLDANNTRILWQLIQAEFAAIVLLVGCHLVFIKRAGVTLLHGGILLLMFNELLVYKTHVEWQMTIGEKEANWYAHDLRYIELAIEREGVAEPAVTPASIGSSNAGATTKEVITVPWELLWNSDERKSLGRLQSDTLPFDLEVVRFYKNARMRDPQPGEKLLATKGQGLSVTMDEERGSSSGSSAEADKPAAWVKITAKHSDQVLGIYMLSALLGTVDAVDKVQVGGAAQLDQTYDVSLRFQRMYKPYVIELDEVRKDDYLGSNIPRNYSSQIKLYDAASATPMTTLIRMNDPLRYKGETFYQSGFDDRGGKKRTTLQIVSNTGWMIPYMSCMIVLTGMVAHFLSVMTRYFSRLGREGYDPRVSLWGNLWNYFRAASQARATAKPVKTKLKDAVQFEVTTARFDVHEKYRSPWPLTVTAILLLGFLGYAISRALPSKIVDDQPNLREFGELPAVFKGRVKPLDTLARNSLALISRGETFVDRHGKRQPAIKWLLDLWADFENFKHHRLFFIENPELVKKLGLVRRPDHLYSYKQLSRPEVQKQLQQLVTIARSKDQLKLEPLDKKALELAVRWRVAEELLQSNQGPPIDDLIPSKDLTQDQFQAEARRLAAMHFLQFGRLEELTLNTPLLIPVDARTAFPPAMQKQIEMLFNMGRGVLAERSPNIPTELKLRKVWDHQVQPPGVIAFMDEYHAIFQPGEKTSPMNDYLLQFRTLMHRYYQRDFADFNKDLPSYRQQVTTAFNTIKDGTNTIYSAEKVPTESWFNGWNPFKIAGPFYLIAFLLALVGLVVGQRILQPATYWLLWGVFVVHSVGMLVRMYLSGRPPVTNLYSSALFIGWGMVLLGLLFEAYSRRGFATIAAAAAGFSTLLISGGLYGNTNDWASTGGDTMGVMQAVLDTDFWLATHVVTVALGYATTGLAGVFGAIYLFANALMPNFNQQMEKDLNRATYGTICFAIVFSFVGTVLGGLWADDSWGRFWGWDPKENGALIIVLWNALVLHARWDGMIKERGLAVLSIAGAIVTSWSWFGVNELGIGLHSYGFTEGTLLRLFLFAACSCVVMLLGFFPRRAIPGAETKVIDAKLA